MKFQKILLFGVIPFLIFSLAAVYITYPLIFHLGDFTTGLGDELLISWIHNWNIHTVLSGNLFYLFGANLYYPHESTLAYSDLHLITSIISIIPVLLLREPIAANNFTIIFSLIFLGLSIYLLCYYLTKDFLASVLAGMLVIFSPSIFGYFVHLQMLSIGWVPLAILFFLIFVKSSKSKYLIISLLFFVLQIYNSFLPGYFIVFSYITILIIQWFYKKIKIKKLINIKNIFVFIITFILILPILIPYYSVSKEFAYTRDIREAIHNALQPEDLVYPGPTTRLKDTLLTIFPVAHFSANAELHGGYIGFVFSILTLLSCWYFIKKIKKIDFHIFTFLIIGLIGLILSFGPALHLNRQTVHEPFPIILPYALLYYIAPGFQGFRTPLRWEILFIICIAVVIAIVLRNLLKKYSLRRKMLIYLILFAGVIMEFTPALNFTPIVKMKDFPAVYSWLATTPKETKIIEMPIYNWNTFPYANIEQFRDYYSIAHFRKTVNGASGFSPPPWQTLVTNLLTDFPNDKSIASLRKLGINYIIVHKDEYERMYNDKFVFNGKNTPSGQVIVDILSKNKSVILKKNFENDYVYELK